MRDGIGSLSSNNMRHTSQNPTERHKICNIADQVGLTKVTVVNQRDKDDRTSSSFLFISTKDVLHLTETRSPFYSDNSAAICRTDGNHRSVFTVKPCFIAHKHEIELSLDPIIQQDLLPMCKLVIRNSNAVVWHISWSYGVHTWQRRQEVILM